MKSRMRAIAPLRSSTHSTKSGKKCWHWKSSSHWPDACPKFAPLGMDQRIKVAKKKTFSSVLRKQPEETIGLIIAEHVESV